MKHTLEGNGLSETVEREAIFGRNLFLLLSQNLILLRKSDFCKAGHIINVALDTFPHFVF